MKWNTLTIAAVVLVVYLLLGGVIFHFLEGGKEESVLADTRNFTEAFLAARPCMKQEDLDYLVEVVIRAYDSGIIASTNSSSSPNWDIASSIFFAVTVVTTIGYGHISPSTSGGRVFFVFYAIVGIPLCLVLLSYVGAKLSGLSRKLADKIKCCNKRRSLGRILQTCVITGCGVVLFIMIPSIVFSFIEDWDYGTSLYYSVVSLSTVGFGDYVPGFSASQGDARSIYRIATAVWLIMGLAWLSSMISHLQDYMVEAVFKVEEAPENDNEDENHDLQNKGAKAAEANGSGTNQRNTNNTTVTTNL